jgi:hypothetical protein
VPATSRIVQVKAVSSESKLDWVAPAINHGVVLAGLSSGTVGSGRHSTALGTVRASHPLRC